MRATIFTHYRLRECFWCGHELAGEPATCPHCGRRLREVR